MFKHKLIISTLVAGCLSMGSALAQDKPGLTDEQKAKLAELKAKIESMRGEHGAKHDSLRDARRDEIKQRFAAHRKAIDALAGERKGLHADIRKLVEEYKAKFAAAGADKEALAAELKAKIKALHDAFLAEHKGVLDSLKASRDARIAARKGEWEKKLADGKARFAGIRKDIEARGGGHGGPGPLTPEQIAALKKRFEDRVKEVEGSI